MPNVKKFNKENDLPPRALLVIDNATSHPPDGELVCGEIKAIFLPPNVTPLLQPMDQGVLQNIKCFYRKMLLRSLIENEDDLLSITDILKTVNIKHLIYWVTEAWDKLSDNLLKMSWKKLWPSLTYTIEHSDNEANIRAEVLQLITQVPSCEDANVTDVNEWLVGENEDDELLSDNEIISLIMESPNQDPDEDDEEETKEEEINHSDAAKALEIASKYVEQQSIATQADVMFMRRWYNIASSARFSSLRQRHMTDFLQPGPQ